MKPNYMKSMLWTITWLCVATVSAHAQTFTIRGVVYDKNKSSKLPGASVRIRGTSEGTITDVEGKFAIALDNPAVLVLTSIGYSTQEIPVNQLTAPLVVVMQEDKKQLEEVVVVGSRFNPRSVVKSPVPIDNIDMDKMADVGHLTFDQMLTYNAPSFNATQQAISDATAHINPAELRGLGPSRTLILINGKRKNPSSLVYINDTPGKGEVGADLQSIPTSSIERIEVLRDGASAQYGSDAIAGVVNIVLKKNTNEGDINIFSGATHKGDGFTYSLDANYGFAIGDRGYMNISAGYLEQDYTDRAGEPGEDVLFGVGPENEWIQDNPDLGMNIGQPEMTKSEIFFNTVLPFRDGGEFYAFGGSTLRRGRSFAAYRTPYWISVPNPADPTGTNGFQPTFETDIADYTGVFGLRGKKGGWNLDASIGLGGNTIDYTVGNSVNLSFADSIHGGNVFLSPTSFNVGGYSFSHILQNLDISRDFGRIRFALGGEFRAENFIARAGEEASYIGNGVQSFPGLQPANEVNAKRYNVGFYADAETDVTKNWLLGGTIRYENYSDFGDNVSWKLNTCYSLWDDKLNLRAAYSTGFRAPSLHQIHLSNIQTLISGGTISNQGTFDNGSPVVKSLGVPELKEELSRNISAGFTFQPVPKLLLTADYYNVSVDDRVVFTSSLSTDDPDSPLGQILDAFDVTSIKFFINGIDTKTQGADVVASYDNIRVGSSGNLGFNLLFNYNKTEIQGKLKTPNELADYGSVLFDRKEQSRIETARPNTKLIFGINYAVSKWKFIMNLTRFGEVIWRHASEPKNDQTFSAKMTTDLNVSYRFSDAFLLSFGGNNIFSIYPDAIDPKDDPITNLGGRFKYPWEVNQFGFNGAFYYLKMNIKIKG